MAAINVSVGGNTRQLERDIQKAVNKSYNINLKTKGEQPLGRITGKVNEFTKSLDASNARVIAFGASAGLIFGLQRAFEALVTSTINVQKSLAEINTVLNISTSQLNKFGSELFNIAKNTGQSFDEVAKAATEFSRQGLGVEETLKRTNNALVLARLSGLDTVKSVEALTAAVNSFASEAVTATEIVNKFATVDAAFAVSSADLAEAIARVGSSAAQSGVSLNELIAIVTSAQQTTARGGAVIGNSFKTIFTRLQRQDVIDLLGNLGIGTTDAQGQIKSTIQLLQDLANVYDSLGQIQQSAVAEKVGGVFQINILKSALADLGKEFSVYNSALSVAGTATDQAIRRNEELNKTYAAQLNALQQNATQLASNVGERVLGPSFDRLVGGANALLGGINESDGVGVGEALANGILDGLGKVLSGPGLALIGGILIKLIKDFSVFATGSIKELLGLNTATKQQAELQKSVNQILQQNPNLLKLMQQGTAGVTSASKILLENLRAQTVELQKQNALAAQVAKTLYTGGARIVGGVPTVTTGKGKAAGYIPNFANAELLAAKEENYTAQRSFEVDNPVLGPITVNNREKTNAVPVGGYPPGTFVVNPKQLGQVAGIPLEPIERMKNKAFGFIPNFAKIPAGMSLDEAIKAGFKRSQLSQRYGKAAVDEKKGVVSEGGKPIPVSKETSTARPKKNIQNLLGFRLPTILTPSNSGPVTRIKQNLFKDGTDGEFNFQAYKINTKNPKLNDEFEQTVGKGNFIDKFIDKNLIPFAQRIASVVQAPPVDPNKFTEIKGAKGFRSSIEGALGGIFDAAITTAIGIAGKRDDQGDFDVRIGTGGQQGKYVDALFGPNSLGGRSSDLGDFKKNTGRDAAKSMIDKTIKEYGAQIQSSYKGKSGKTREKKASGFIPNFAALGDAINREKSAGIPSNKIYVASDRRLAASGYNPLGLGVFNTIDEPTSASRSSAISSRGYAGGFIPNFVEPEGTEQGFGATIGALTAQLSGLGLILALNKESYKNSLAELTKSNVSAAKINTKTVTEQARENTKNAPKGSEERKQAAKQIREARSLERQAASGTLTQKATAGFDGGGGALAITFLAPMITEAIVNGMEKGTKASRENQALVSGVGQTASFAAAGFMVGGPVGAAIGTAIGAIMTFVDWLNQASTDLPELSAAVQASSEKLNKFNDSSQKVLTSFEQIAGFRESGRPEKAGELETALLQQVSKDFAGNQELINQASIAIINKDFESLKEALAKNTEALLLENKQKEEELAAQAVLENVNKAITDPAVQAAMLTPDMGGGGGLPPPIYTPQIETGTLPSSDEVKKQLQDEFTKLFTLTDITDRQQFGIGELENLQKQISSGALKSGSAQDILTNLGADKTVADKFAKISSTEDEAKYKEFLAALAKVVDERVNLERSILNNTKEGNRAIEIANKALDQISGNFSKLAGLSNESLALQAAFKNLQSQAVANYNVAALGESAETAKTFGAKAQGQGFEIQGGLLKAQSDFDKNIGDSLESVTTTIGQVFNQAFVNSFAKIGEAGADEKDPEKRARNQLAEAQRLSESLISATGLDNIENIIGASQFTETGFDVQAIVDSIKNNEDFIKLGADQQKEAVDKVTAELTKANQTLQSSKVLLEQQKAILANQKLNEIMREFATAIQNSFGGVAKFLEGNLGDKTIADQMFDILAERQAYRGAAEREGVMDRQTSTEMGRTAGRYTDLLESITGRKGIFGTEDKLVQEEITGYSNNIEDIFNQAMQDAISSGDVAAQEGIGKAMQELIVQSGLLKEGEKPEDFTGDMREVFDSIAKMAVTQRRETAQVEEGIKTAALQRLSELPGGEELAKIAEQGSQYISETSILVAQGDRQNQLLEEIKAAIEKAQDESTKATLDAEQQRATDPNRNPFVGNQDVRLDGAQDQPLPNINLNDNQPVTLDLSGTQNVAPSSFLTPSLEDPSTLNPTVSLFPQTNPLGTPAPTPPPESPFIPTAADLPAAPMTLDTVNPFTFDPSIPLTPPTNDFSLAPTVYAPEETELPLPFNAPKVPPAPIPTPTTPTTPPTTPTTPTTPIEPVTPAEGKSFWDKLFDAIPSMPTSMPAGPSVNTESNMPMPPKTVNTTPVSPNAGTTAAAGPTASVNVSAPVTVNAMAAAGGGTDNTDWSQLGPEIQTLVDQNIPQILAKIGAKVDRTETVVNNMLANPQFASYRPAPSQTASQGTQTA